MRHHIKIILPSVVTVIYGFISLSYYFQWSNVLLVV